MSIDMRPNTLRRTSRVAAATVGLILVASASPAVADTPEAWQDSANGSALDAILLLVGVPLAVIAVLALLTYLPSMMRRESAGSALAFQESPEWFGGPRQGAAVAETQEPVESGKGGASGTW